MYYVLLAGNPAYGRFTRSGVEDEASPAPPTHIAVKAYSKPSTTSSYLSSILLPFLSLPFLLLHVASSQPSPPPPPSLLPLIPSYCPPHLHFPSFSSRSKLSSHSPLPLSLGPSPSPSVPLFLSPSPSLPLSLRPSVRPSLPPFRDLAVHPSKRMCAPRTNDFQLCS